MNDELPVTGLGSRSLGSTIAFQFTTTVMGKPTSLLGSPAVKAYISGTTTPISGGITLTADYNSTPGLNNVSIVASIGNGYSAGQDYEMVITAGTVDGLSAVGAEVGRFSLV